MHKAHWLLATALLSLSTMFSQAASARPLKALLISGGCCHDYTGQKSIIAEGIGQRANVEWTIIQDPSTGTTGRPSIYSKKNWSKGFDVVVHNECFADEKQLEWLEHIVKEHRQGVPALVIHCAMHCYRAPTNEWFKFVGVTSHRHGSHFAYSLRNVNPQHPVMKGFPAEWQTPKEELYNIANLWPQTVPLGTGYSPETKRDETCVWVSQYGKARVFGTTVGHYNQTMSDPVYLDMLTRGLLWACNKLDEDGKPVAGYGPAARPTTPSAK